MNKGRRYLPYAFTEQGIAMLSAVLRSDEAIVSVKVCTVRLADGRFGVAVDRPYQ